MAHRRNTCRHRRSRDCKGDLRCKASGTDRLLLCTADHKYTVFACTSCRRFRTDRPDCCNHCSRVPLPERVWHARELSPDCQVRHGRAHCSNTIWHFSEIPTCCPAHFSLPCSSRSARNCLLPGYNCPPHSRWNYYFRNLRHRKSHQNHQRNLRNPQSRHIRRYRKRLCRRTLRRSFRNCHSCILRFSPS